MRSRVSFRLKSLLNITKHKITGLCLKHLESGKWWFKQSQYLLDAFVIQSLFWNNSDNIEFINQINQWFFIGLPLLQFRTHWFVFWVKHRLPGTKHFHFIHHLQGTQSIIIKNVFLCSDYKPLPFFMFLFHLFVIRVEVIDYFGYVHTELVF